MELALAVQDAKQLSLLENRERLSPMEQETIAILEENIKRKFQLTEPDRLYFGSEFCQYRIAELTDVQKAYEYTRERGYAFTFVTPYVPENGMKLLIPIFEWLDSREDAVEVVVNDWGMSYTVATKYPNLQIVIGRLLNKMIRDPRVAHLYNQKNAPERAKSVFMNSSFETPYFRQFLERLQVKRIEYDSFIQPIEKSVDREGLATSLYLGYGVIATGRSCLVGTLHKPREEKFQGDIQCKQQCCHYIAQMENTRQQLGQLPVRTMQKGNSAFYQQTEELVGNVLDWADDMQVDRLIVSPKIPV
ncbi:hypothetical protein ACFPRA_02710 [Sporosarcina soli]|uniref:Uncharacterized protein n=1 Tax=Sporosarcina soli TaxID=334736 RepID=A0ABW0TGS0_9BACL